MNGWWSVALRNHCCSVAPRTLHSSFLTDNFLVTKLTFSAHSIMVHPQRRVIPVSIHRYICKIIKKKIMKTMKIRNITRKQLTDISPWCMQRKRDISRKCAELIFSDRDEFRLSLQSKKTVLRISVLEKTLDYTYKIHVFRRTWNRKSQSYLITYSIHNLW